MSWPPDGDRVLGEKVDMSQFQSNTVAFIISRKQHGTIVLATNRLWWCPVSSFVSETSGSAVVT